MLLPWSSPTQCPNWLSVIRCVHVDEFFCDRYGLECLDDRITYFLLKLQKLVVGHLMKFIQRRLSSYTCQIDAFANIGN